MKKDKIDFEKLIEKYKFLIGAVLLVLILVGSGVMLWRENYAKPSLESRIMNYESRISQLEAERDKVPASPAGGQEAIGKQATNSNIEIPNNDQNSNAQNNQTEQGRVAGTSTSSNETIQQSNNREQASNQQLSSKVNINTASTGELESLPGIGPTYAKRIVEYRDANGGFKSIDEIKNVKGIGEKTFGKFKELISVD